MRRGPYWPQLYLVREDGDLRLRTWVLSMLMLDRADQAPSYQQFLAALREKVRPRPRLAASPYRRGRPSLFRSPLILTNTCFAGLWILVECYLLEDNGMVAGVSFRGMWRQSCVLCNRTWCTDSCLLVTNAVVLIVGLISERAHAFCTLIGQGGAGCLNAAVERSVT